LKSNRSEFRCSRLSSPVVKAILGAYALENGGCRAPHGLFDLRPIRR
jgi:hypothetical protein